MSTPSPENPAASASSTTPPAATPPPAAPLPSGFTPVATSTETPGGFVPLSAAGPGNFPAALGLGFAAALVGAAIWAAITLATNYQIGWMAVGVGFLVGFAVRFGGKGSTPKFAVAGAVLALFGCALGNLLTGIGAVSQAQNASFLAVASHLTPGLAIALMEELFQPMDLLFYGIAVFQGFKLSVLPANK